MADIVPAGAVRESWGCVLMWPLLCGICQMQDIVIGRTMAFVTGVFTYLMPPFLKLMKPLGAIPNDKDIYV